MAVLSARRGMPLKDSVSDHQYYDRVPENLPGTLSKRSKQPLSQHSALK